MRTWLQLVLVLALAVYGLTVPAGAMACCMVAPGHAAAAVHDMAMASTHMPVADPSNRHTELYGPDMQSACEHPACMSAAEPSPHLQLAASQALEVHVASPVKTVMAVPAPRSASDTHPRFPVRSTGFGGAPVSLRI